jgi:glycogen debranching enzyme
MTKKTPLLSIPLISQRRLRKLAYRSLLELATDEGINASGKEDVFGCIFGRDSALTILKILRAHTNKPSLGLLEISRRALLTLTQLQGKVINPESNEAPGKFIHEYRKEIISHISKADMPMFVYPDGTIKNYDTIDATPLALIAIYKYFQITQDGEFLITVLPAVEAGLNWIFTYGDLDKDYLLEYDFSPKRKHGGPMLVQSWTDSHESLRQKNGQMPKYPIAPVEVQGYAWLALKLWADFYQENSPVFAQKLQAQARELKKQFNRTFIIKNNKHFFCAQALDGDKKKIKTITGNPLLLLWATYFKDGRRECILEDKYIKDIAWRGFENDLFDAEAGIRTMSTKSSTFNPNDDSYHNGTFWPILNGQIHEGLENWDFRELASKLKQASIKPLLFFQTPIELYSKKADGSYGTYLSPQGQTSSKTQAWTAAVMLDLLSTDVLTIVFRPFLKMRKLPLKYLSF